MLMCSQTETENTMSKWLAGGPAKAGGRRPRSPRSARDDVKAGVVAGRREEVPAVDAGARPRADLEDVGPGKGVHVGPEPGLAREVRVPRHGVRRDPPPFGAARGEVKEDGDLLERLGRRVHGQRQAEAERVPLRSGGEEVVLRAGHRPDGPVPEPNRNHRLGPPAALDVAPDKEHVAEHKEVPDLSRDLQLGRGRPALTPGFALEQVKHGLRARISLVSEGVKLHETGAR